jgi:hypothetical protein
MKCTGIFGLQSFEPVDAESVNDIEMTIDSGDLKKGALAG